MITVDDVFNHLKAIEADPPAWIDGSEVRPIMQELADRLDLSDKKREELLCQK